jgi:hypothetical protein
MSSTARERWLFEVLRGADLLESHGSKYYRPKGQIKVSTHKGQLTIRDGDQFDVSKPDCIRVIREGFAIRIPWLIVSSVSSSDTDSGAPDSFGQSEVIALSERSRRPRRQAADIKSGRHKSSRFPLFREIGNLLASR